MQLLREEMNSLLFEYSNLGTPNPSFMAQLTVSTWTFLLAAGLGKNVPNTNAARATIKYFIRVILVIIAFICGYHHSNFNTISSTDGFHDVNGTHNVGLVSINGDFVTEAY